MSTIYETPESSLITGVDYDNETQEMTVHFKSYYVDQITYYNVPMQTYIDFIMSKSKGKYYLKHIKQQKTRIMADLIIKCKVDITKVIKDWLFSGKQGTYLNFTVLYNVQKDSYGHNGMITQDVPTEIYKANKEKRGPILGNCKVFEKGGASTESLVGKETGTLASSLSDADKAQMFDDLPF